MTYEKVEFGKVGNEKIFLFRIANLAGNFVEITNYGGIVHAWFCKDNKGNVQDILLGCNDLEGYKNGHPYFGAIIGRYGNRIAFGKFELDEILYSLATNLPPHHLHGGNHGFDQKIWTPEILINDNICTLILSSCSAHMEEGYPGNLDIKVVYTFTEENELIIEYFCKTDQNTHINLTNHCYFNLSGEQLSDILDHEVCIKANYISEVDETLIPTGKKLRVEGTPMDFNIRKSLHNDLLADHELLRFTNGFDHNYILEPTVQKESIASVFHPTSGRFLSIFTDQPGVQLYTGNWLKNVDGKSGKYKNHAGLCLETQHFPDSPNHPEFPSTLLKPEETFYSKTTYRIDIK